MILPRYKSSEIANMNLFEFEVLLEKLHEKYTEDWDRYYKNRKAPMSIPSYMKTYERVFFFGYTKRHQGFSSLYFFMLQNKDVIACWHYHFEKEEFNRKDLYRRYSIYKGLKKDENYNEPIHFSKGYSFIYFLYLGLDSFMAFKEKYKLEIESKKKGLTFYKEKVEKQLTRTTGKDVYYFIGLRISQKRVVESKFHIDFETGDVYMETEGEASYSGGKVRYEFPYLEIRFDRESKRGKEWMPFTAYFEVRNNFNKLPFLFGIACGVSYNAHRAIAGNYVLVKEEYYAECSEKIHRYLFQQSHGLEVYVSSMAQSTTDLENNLAYIGSDSAVMESLIGEHEIYNIGRTKDEFLRSYVFEIRSDFYGHITSSYNGYNYKARFRVAGAAIIVEVAQVNKNTEAKRYSVLSNMIVIDAEAPLEIGEYKAYRAMCTGASRYYKMEGFPMLLLIKPPKPKAKSISKKDIGTFLKSESYNKDILKALFDLERKRFDIVQEMFEGIDLEV